MLKSVKTRQSDALTRLSWQDFERLLADHYRDLGYLVEHHGTASSGARSDGGIDLKLRKENQFILVQCKHWNAMQVPHNDVHQLMGIMDNEDATSAILVTSGEFTAAAQAAASKKGKVQLIDGVALRHMLGARLPPELPGNFDWNQMPAPSATRGFSRRGHARTVSRRSQTGIGKAVVAVVGLAMVIALILVVRGQIVTVIAGLGPKPKASHASPPGRNDASGDSLPIVGMPPKPFDGSARLQRAGQPNAVRTAAGLLAYDAAAAIGDQDGAKSAFDASHRQFMRDAKIADARFPVNRELARSSAKQVAGVRSAVWLDRENLLLIVDRNERRSYETIDRVCVALQPLGDTLGVVVNLQSGAASTGAELATLSRNCQLAPGDRAFMQSQRQVDVVSPSIRAEHQANNLMHGQQARPTNTESMKILEATTPELKD